MYWQESRPDVPLTAPGDIVDIAYDISCRALPVDHAWALSRAILAVLPWLATDAGAGLHPLHVADSGNGWMRPEAPDDLLVLSRRTKLVLRIPDARVDDARQLSGARLDVHGHDIDVGAAQVRPLSTHTTLFSRYVVADPDCDENRFLAEAVTVLAGLDVRPKKMLCGMSKVIRTPDGPVAARSLMITELAQEESFALQRHGLGPRRELGCGLFIPHKDIASLGMGSASRL
jgi:CRISPR-associated protein Cas6